MQIKTMRFHLTLVRMAKINKISDSSWNKKRKTYPLLVGVRTCTVTIKSGWQFLRKVGVDLLQNPAILLLSINLKDAPSYHKDLYSTMLIAAVFIIARTWKKTRCFSREEWTKEIWYIYTMGNYSALKNDIIKFAVKWTELRNTWVMYSRSRKKNMVYIHLYAYISCEVNDT